MLAQTSSALARFGWSTSLLFTLLTAGCGEEVVQCFDDRSCGLNMRCNKPKFGDPGTCEACASQEISYDGIDNDCSPRTPDLDLDGDGDNWVSAPIRPGTDCNDEDPTVKPGLSELCNDQKDNDCDGKVDEKECGDREPPTVNIRMPLNNQLIIGAFSVVVDATDDVGLTELAVNVNGVEQRSMSLGEVTNRTVTVELNSENLTDTLSELQVVVTDVAGGTASDMININVDNHTSPAITLLRPTEGRAYGGTMNIQAEVEDPSGVASVEMLIDGVSARTFTSSATSGTFDLLVDTRTMTEGAHTFRIVAVEGRPGTPLSTTRDVAFTTDNTAPVVNIISPLDRAVVMGSIATRVEATDASGIFRIDFAGASGPAPLDTSFDTTTVANGDQVLTAVALDNVEVDGSSGNSATDSIRVRIMNPNGGAIVSIDNIADGDPVVGRVKIDYSVTAPLTGPNGFVEVKLDDVIVYRGHSVEIPPIDFGRVPREVALNVRVYDHVNQATVTIDVNVVEPIELEQSSCFGAGTDPTFAIADITEDGVLDIVQGGEDLSILEGEITSDGRWHARRILGFPELSMLGVIRSAHAGNVTGPTGGLEIFGLEIATYKVQRYRYVPGVGEAVYPTLQSLGTPAQMPNGVTSIASGDVDNDGDIDLVLFGGGLFALSRWDGTTFEPSTPILGPPMIQFVTLADLDDDGDLDILGNQLFAGSVPASVVTMLNDGTGVFGIPTQINVPAALGNPSSRVSLGDANGDGALDLLGATFSGGYLMTGTVGTPGVFNYSARATFISVLGQGTDAMFQDLTGDGRPEWLFGGLSNGFEVWSNPAAGMPTPVVGYAMGRNMVRQELLDLNGDGNIDVIGFDASLDEICVSFGLGGLDFYGPAFKEISNTRSFTAADLTGTPEPEILVGWDDNNLPLVSNVRVFSRSGNSYGEVATLPTNASPSSLVVADLDATAGLDILAGTLGNTQLLLSQGGLSYALSTIGGGIGASSEYVGVGDANDDGSVDLIATYNTIPADGARIWSLPVGVQIGEAPGGNDPTGIVVGNLDSDAAGTDDFLVYGLTTSALSTWNGVGWVTNSFAGIGGTAAVAYDINSDGRTDLLFAAGAPGLSILYGDPQTGFQAPATTTVDVPLASVGVVDVNGDGLQDVVGLSFAGDIYVFVKGANGAFLNPTRLMSTNRPFQLVIDDLDDDGTQDIAVGNKNAGFTINHVRPY